MNKKQKWDYVCQNTFGIKYAYEDGADDKKNDEKKV